MMGVLQELDSDRKAQKLIAEQFIAEASLGNSLFHAFDLRSDSEMSFLTKISEPLDADEWWPKFACAPL